MNELTVKAKGGTEIKFEHCRAGKEEERIFIYSDFISGEWPPGEIGVRIMRQEENVHVQFFPRSSGIYSGWFFEIEEMERLVKWFRLVGFPVPDPDPMRYEGDKYAD